jgi:glyoxylase-like metal-dependent hydrolase (beta-lactamase superfamily II)
MRLPARLALVVVHASALALLAGPAPAQQDFDAVEIRTVPVADGIHMLVGRGGNIGVSTGADGPLLVDDQYAPLTPKIVAAVRALQDAPIRFVVNTHWHGDHTGGNENLGEAGALIVAHHAVRRRMAEGLDSRLLGRTIPPAPEVALPVLTFGEDLDLHWNGQTLELRHVPPAHTDGDAVVWFREADVVHAGDTYFNGSYPFVDLESGGSVEGMLAAVDGILARAGDGTRVIPGHGPLSNRAELRVYRDMLATVRDRIARAVAEGKDADATVAARPTADLDAKWGGGFLSPEQFVRIVHADLSR